MGVQDHLYTVNALQRTRAGGARSGVVVAEPAQQQTEPEPARVPSAVPVGMPVPGPRTRRRAQLAGMAIAIAMAVDTVVLDRRAVVGGPALAALWLQSAPPRLDGCSLHCQPLIDYCRSDSGISRVLQKKVV